MLNYVLSNIFDSPAQTLVNTVNTVGVMGKGIAAEFKQRYPEMFEKYRRFCSNGSLTVGKLYLYKSPNKWVLNLPTKAHWRQPSKVEYVEAGLKKFVDTYLEHGITSVSFPQLGSGNGGLDWDRVVRPLMDRYLSDLDISVFIHVAPNVVNFRPEHIEGKAKRNIEAPRGGRDLVGFFDDLSKVTELNPSPGGGIVPNEDFELPAVRLNDEVVVPGQDLAVLWETLKVRGAVKPDEFPVTLLGYVSEVKALLLQLPYIGSIQYESKLEGLCFAPEADLRKSPSSVLAARETPSR